MNSKNMFAGKSNQRQKDLVRGVLQFWDTVAVEECTKYVNHLNKVIPKVIDLQGSATGY